MIRVAVLTSVERRHYFFANALARAFDVVGVVREQKKQMPIVQEGDAHQVIRDHFADLIRTEARYFGEEPRSSIPSDAELMIPRGHINTDEVCAWLEARAPQYIILFGTSLVKYPILERFAGRIVNIHLGLSPYYRGSGTNFWPLVDGLPECVGATIHVATPEVDGGPVLVQVRPSMQRDDSNHDIGCKTILAGAESMIRGVQALDQGLITGEIQRTDIGKVFKKKDFNAEAVLQMRRHFAEGLIPQYLDAKSDRDARYPIIEL